MDPHDRRALTDHFQANAALGNIAAAAADAVLARQLDPTDAWLRKQTEWTVATLRHEGAELEVAGKHADAAKLFSLGLQLASDDRDMLLRLAQSQNASGASAGEIAAQLAAAPDDFELRLRIDSGYAAANRYGDVVPMWSEFIGSHPNDPRPFRERAGARWHLGQTKQALADMQRACELGLRAACNDAQNMKSRLGL